MTRLLTPLSLAALVALASPSFAQETNDSGEENSADAQSSLGDETPQSGDGHILSEHGNWKLRCITTNIEANECRLAQLLLDNSGNPAVQISLTPVLRRDGTVAAAQVITPLFTLLEYELVIAIGDKRNKRSPFEWCSPLGCHAQLFLTQEELDALKEEEPATVSFRVIVAPDQRVARAELDIPLDGFDEGYAAAEEEFEKLVEAVTAIEAAEAEAEN